MKKLFFGFGAITSVGVVLPMAISCGTKEEGPVSNESFESKAAFEAKYAKKIFVLSKGKDLNKVSFKDFKNNASEFYLTQKLLKDSNAKKLAPQNDKVFIVLLDAKKISQKGDYKDYEKFEALAKKFSSEKGYLVVHLFIWKTSVGNIYSNLDLRKDNMQKDYKNKISAIEKIVSQ